MRLACVKHAASVHSEPGSNSPINLYKINRLPPTFTYFLKLPSAARLKRRPIFTLSRYYPVFKDQSPLLPAAEKTIYNLYDFICQHKFS